MINVFRAQRAKTLFLLGKCSPLFQEGRWVGRPRHGQTPSRSPLPLPSHVTPQVGLQLARARGSAHRPGTMACGRCPRTRLEQCGHDSRFFIFPLTLQIGASTLLRLFCPELLPQFPPFICSSWRRGGACLVREFWWHSVTHTIELFNFQQYGFQVQGKAR